MIVPLAKTDEMWRDAVAGMDKPDAVREIDALGVLMRCSKVRGR